MASSWGLDMRVVLCDESEAYFVGQALAGLTGDTSSDTLLFVGDENKRLEDSNLNPACTRAPWVSAGRRGGAP